MEIAITVLLLIVGLVLIIKGGDFFVDAASWMAEASGIPKLIVGATVVSFATTLPELLVSIFAALDARAAEALSPGSGIGMVDMSIGNAIGSVTANLGLIMGIALVAIPMAIRRKDYMLKMILMLVAAAVAVCFSLFDNGVGMVASILLIIIFVIAMYDNIHEAVVAVKGGAKGQQLDEPVTKKAVITNVVKFLIARSARSPAHSSLSITAPRSLPCAAFRIASSPSPSSPSARLCRSLSPRSPPSRKSRARSPQATSSAQISSI